MKCYCMQNRKRMHRKQRNVLEVTKKSNRNTRVHPESALSEMSIEIGSVCAWGASVIQRSWKLLIFVIKVLKLGVKIMQ